MIAKNPFVEQVIAQEWIAFIEKNTEPFYTNELFPYLYKWSTEQKGRVIDIGCGQGNTLAQLHPHSFSKYVGVEPSPHLLRRAQELYGKEAGVQFKYGYAEALPCFDAEYNAALSINVFSHVADLQLALHELSRVLLPEALVLIVSLNPEMEMFWRDQYKNQSRIAGGIVGDVITAQHVLHMNTYYPHSNKAWERGLQETYLEPITSTTMGATDTGVGVFKVWECIKKI